MGRTANKGGKGASKFSGDDKSIGIAYLGGK